VHSEPNDGQSSLGLRALRWVWTSWLAACLSGCSATAAPTGPKQNTASEHTDMNAGASGRTEQEGASAADAGDKSASPRAGSGGTSGVPASGGAGATASAAGAPSVQAGASGSGTAGAAGMASPPSTMVYPPLDPAAIGTPMKIADGFSLAESPLWDPCGHRLLFADVSASGGGKINAIDSNGDVTEFMTGTGNTNGMAWDIDGSLILAQMNGHVARRSASGVVTAIDSADVDLHTPDDVTVRSDGTIYLSDGDFCPIGNLLGYSSALPVYTIKPNTTALIKSGTVRGPNGIELSPDEKVLYVNGYGEGKMYRFDVMPDGTIMKQPDAFVSGMSDADSMCLDAAGNLYVAVSSGIQVLSPDGTKIKLIPVSAPGGSCSKAGMTNCGFGGDDGKTLYITSWTTLFKIDDMPIPGLDWMIGQQRAKCL
jgi:gluconolactonase